MFRMLPQLHHMSDMSTVIPTRSTLKIDRAAYHALAILEQWVTKVIAIMINVILIPNKRSMVDVRDAPPALLRVQMDMIASLFQEAIPVHLVEQER